MCVDFGATQISLECWNPLCLPMLGSLMWQECRIDGFDHPRKPLCLSQNNVPAAGYSREDDIIRAREARQRQIPPGLPVEELASPARFAETL